MNIKVNDIIFSPCKSKISASGCPAPMRNPGWEAWEDRAGPGEFLNQGVTWADVVAWVLPLQGGCPRTGLMKPTSPQDWLVSWRHWDRRSRLVWSCLPAAGGSEEQSPLAERTLGWAPGSFLRLRCHSRAVWPKGNHLPSLVAGEGRNMGESTCGLQRSRSLPLGCRLPHNGWSGALAKTADPTHQAAWWQAGGRPRGN